MVGEKQEARMKTTQLITAAGWLLIAIGAACSDEWSPAPVASSLNAYSPESMYGRSHQRYSEFRAPEDIPFTNHFDPTRLTTRTAWLPNALGGSIVDERPPSTVMPQEQWPTSLVPVAGSQIRPNQITAGEIDRLSHFNRETGLTGESLPSPEDSAEDWLANSEAPLLLPDPQDANNAVTGIESLANNVVLPERTMIATRVGAWSVDSGGNPAKVGEFQSLDSSFFGNLDGLLTNGIRTLDFSADVLDKDASQIRARYYGPSISTRIEHERYLRRLDRDPLEGYVDFDRQPPLPLPGPPENFRGMREDLTVGEDFAIRVQELNASMRGKLTSHVNWRLNVWAMRKHGERQAVGMAHCFTAQNAIDTDGNPVGGVACHMLSQRQRIDWMTTQFEPVVSGKVGPVTAEYSHTIRALGTDDQLVTRPYDNLGIVGDQPYGVVPENFTHIGRLKLGVAFAGRRSAYARLYSGNTQNETRNTNREFRGFDFRISDRSIEGVSFVAHAKKYIQAGEFPTFLDPFENAESIRFPINYDRTTVGFDTTWRPFFNEWSRFSNIRLGCGYQYRELQRENATYTEQGVTADQSATQMNNVFFRAAMGWSPELNSRIQYRLSFVNDPLFALSTNATTNSSLPTESHRVELQNTWTPSQSFLVSGLVGFASGRHFSDVASFQEDNYDLVFTGWYAPTPRWSLSAGLAFYSNWIDQGHHVRHEK